MISVESINDKIQMLPVSSQREVIEFIDDLLESSANGNHTQKASEWEAWAKSHSQDITILDDSREVIYEDE